MLENDDYESIGDTSWDDIPVVKPLPKGPWLLQGRNAKRMKAREADDSHEAASPYVLFFYKALEPLADVDDAELEALGTEYDVESNTLSFRIYVESKIDFRSKVLPHLAKHGIVPGVDEATGKPESIDATLKRFRGAKVIGVLDKRTYTDRAGELRTDNSISSFYTEKEPA